jgi:pteridine reductase
MNGTSALVTGGAARVGRTIALRLAREGYGIGLHYHSSAAAAHGLAEEIRAAGGQVRLYKNDLSRDGEAGKLAEAVLQEQPDLRLLVNNASVWERKSIEAITEDDLESAWRINLRAPLLLSLALGRGMRDRGEGAIVNLLDWSIERPYPDYVPYTVAKAGLAAATRGLARAMAPHVRVNGLALGPVLLHEGATPEETDLVVRAVPLGRIGTPEEVADAVVYLSKASFVTGTILTIDGGRSLR